MIGSIDYMEEHIREMIKDNEEYDAIEYELQKYEKENELC